MDYFLELQRAINETAIPVGKQAEAQNYKKGRFTLHGFKIAVENPRGTVRSKTSASGIIWSNLMKATYGYFCGTKGNDGDEVDVFLGEYLESDTVWIINQLNKEGNLDEHKVMMGFMTVESATHAYNKSYDFGWDGLGSIVKLTLEQFRWWLQNADKTKPAQLNLLPFDAGADMSEVTTDSLSTQEIFDQVCSDDKDGFLLDSVTVNDILDDADGIMALDALVIPYNMVQRKMNQMMGILKIVAEDDVKPTSLQVTDPFKQRGTTNVAAVIELADGQTISIFFHNPDVTPQKISPTDQLVSWKCMLNKKDVTIVVAPEKGADLNVREVSRRIMKLATKNSDRFAKANVKKAERTQALEVAKSEVETKQATLENINKEIADLEVRKQTKDEKAKNLGSSDVNAVIESSEFKSAQEQMADNIGMIYRIDEGIEKGYTRALFVSSLANKLKSIKKNKSDLFLALALAWLNKFQEGFNKPTLSARHGAWKLSDTWQDYTGLFKPYRTKEQQIAESVAASKVAEQAKEDPTQITKEDLEELNAGFSKPARIEKVEHYSEQVIALLIGEYNWQGDISGIEKTFTGVGGGGELNPDGTLILTAKFDERGRYLALYKGFDEIFDIDARDLDPLIAATQFNTMTNNYVFAGEEKEDFGASDKIARAKELVSSAESIGDPDQIAQAKELLREAESFGSEVAQYTAKEEPTLANGQAALKAISPFLSGMQRETIADLMKGEEGEFFIEKALEIKKTIDTMPKTYEQDGKGNDSVAYLHYFKGSVDSYITEKDMSGDGTHQAFGYQDLGYGGELGYISIAEVTDNDLELDLHWTPKTINEIKGDPLETEEGRQAAIEELDKNKISEDEAKVEQGTTDADVKAAERELLPTAAEVQAELGETPDQLRVMTQDDYEAKLEALTEDNLHPEALVLMAKRLGDSDQIARAEALMAEQYVAGELTSDMDLRRSQLRNELTGADTENGRSDALISELDKLGWNAGVSIAKTTIGGGRSTVNNPEGQRNVYAAYSPENISMIVKHGDKVLVEVPYNPDDSVSENAVKLNEAVRAQNTQPLEQVDPVAQEITDGADKEWLEKVIAGEVDMMDAEFSEKLLNMYDEYEQGDPEMFRLVSEASDAYANFTLALQ